MDDLKYEQKLDYLFSIKSESLTNQDIFNLFNKKIEKNVDGSRELQEPMFLVTQSINVKKDQLPNIDKDIVTTVGKYIFNLACISYAFGNKIPYVNEVMDSGSFSKLNDKIVDEILMGRISGEEFGKYQTRLVWLNNFGELFIPGASINLLVLPKEIKKELQRLIDENRESIIKGDHVAYHNNVEVPILKFAKAWFIDHNEPGWVLYAKGGKPSFENTFKNMYLTVGPIMDIATGKYAIAERSFNDGVPNSEINVYANSAIAGAYKRGVQTQESGAKTKYFASAFQSLKIVEEDCGSTHGIEFSVTAKNKDVVKWTHVKDVSKFVGPGKSTHGDTKVVADQPWVLLDADNINDYVGKTVIYRSPMYCKSDGGICQKCAGELFKRIGIKNIGLCSMALTSAHLRSSLKAQHNSTISTDKIKFENCFYEFE